MWYSVESLISMQTDKTYMTRDFEDHYEEDDNARSDIDPIS